MNEFGLEHAHRVATTLAARSMTIQEVVRVNSVIVHVLSPSTCLGTVTFWRGVPDVCHVDSRHEQDAVLPCNALEIERALLGKDCPPSLHSQDDEAAFHIAIASKGWLHARGNNLESPDGSLSAVVCGQQVAVTYRLYPITEFQKMVVLHD